MKITILYDNTTTRADLEADWGFACAVEARGKRILFDTGAKGPILARNMEALGVDPAGFDFAVISHDHWDHTGGLETVLERVSLPVYLPTPCAEPAGAKAVTSVSGPLTIAEGIHSTGTLAGIEQSLAVETEGGLAVIVGCSHPGVGAILDAASRFGEVRYLAGGLHGFRDFARLEPLDRFSPMHCTQAIGEIAERFPDKVEEGGAGRVLAFP